MSEVLKYKPLGDMVQRSRPHGGEWVRLEDYDAAQSELSALREELASRNEVIAMKAREVVEAQTAVSDWARKCKDAEQRNASLTKAIADAEYRADQGKVWNGMGWTYTGLHSHGQQKVLDILRAALKPTESGASE